MKQTRPATSILISSAISMLLCILFSNSGSALSIGDISSPFDIGSNWTVCQGYQGPYTHFGQDQYSLDLTKQACDGSTASYTSSASAIVRAPVTGTIYGSYGQYAGSICINTPSGMSIALVHINLSTPLAHGMLVGTGTAIGSIAEPNTRANAGLSHLHIQAWSTPNCFNANQIPFDSSHGTRLCGAPDFTASGPNYSNNGVWSGVSFLVQPCIDTTPVPGAAYRFWSPANKHHFYTTSVEERDYVLSSLSQTWQYEGPAYITATDCSKVSPVYRFWSDRYQGHFYTADLAERDNLVANSANVWSYEGARFCASKYASSLYPDPIYRFWSDQYSSHFYTADPAEKKYVEENYPSSVWRYEGIAYYATR